MFLVYVLIVLLVGVYYCNILVLFLFFILVLVSFIVIVLVSVLGYFINVFYIMVLFLVFGLGMDYIIFVKEMVSYLDII